MDNDKINGAPAAQTPAAQTQTQTQTQAQTQAEQPQAEQKKAEAGAAMAAIVGKMAGKPPEKKPDENPKPEAPPEKKKEMPEGVSKALSRARAAEARLAELQEKHAQLLQKQKDGKATELDEYKMQQMQEQALAIREESAREYNEAAAQELGDLFDDSFRESNEYYGPILNQNAPQMVDALMRMENKFAIMHGLFSAFNTGAVDFAKFVNLPAPAQINILRGVDQQVRQAISAGPQPQPPPAAPAAPPPAVPVPADAAIGAPPADRKAKMDMIISKMARTM